MGFFEEAATDTPQPDAQETGVTVRYTLDIAKVKPSFEPYKKELQDLLNKVRGKEVRDAESEQEMISLGGEVKKLFKKVEEKRKKVIKEPDEFVRGINTFIKTFRDLADTIETESKNKVKKFQMDKLIEQRRLEEEARKAADAEQKRLNELAKEKGVEAPVVPVPIAPEVPKTVRTETGTASTQVKVWKFEITDAAQVPREYLMVDEKKIAQAVKLGVREIAGVRVFEDIEIRYRG